MGKSATIAASLECRGCLGGGLLFRLLAVSATGGGLVSRALACDASGPALPVGGGDGEVDVLLGVHADHELGHVHELLAHPVEQ